MFSYIVHEKTSEKLKLSILVITFIISGCGGGGGDDSVSTTPVPVLTSIHAAPTTQAKALLPINGFNEITYNVSLRRPGVLTAGGLGYDMVTVVPADLTSVRDTCNGQRVFYGGNCQITVRYNGVPRNLLAPTYIPQSYDINIRAVPVDGSTTLNNTIAVSAVQDPLHVALDTLGATAMRNETYRTSNILNTPGWGARVNFEVPTIQTYSIIADVIQPNPLVLPANPGDAALAYPVLALKTRCSNKLIYLVVQRKIETALTADATNNVTVKYHPLIADNIRTGIADPGSVITGLVKILENGQPDINVNADVNAHARTWSGSQKINRLQQLISANDVPQNSSIISVLSNINPLSIYIDPTNQRAREIITVHSLLLPASYLALENYLNLSHGLGDVDNLMLPADPTLDVTAKNSLNTYRTEVAKACAV